MKPGNRLLHIKLGKLCVWKFKVPPTHPHLEMLGSHINNVEIGWWRGVLGNGMERWLQRGGQQPRVVTLNLALSSLSFNVGLIICHFI